MSKLRLVVVLVLLTTLWHVRAACAHLLRSHSQQSPQLMDVKASRKQLPDVEPIEDFLRFIHSAIGSPSSLSKDVLDPLLAVQMFRSLDGQVDCKVRLFTVRSGCF